MKILSSAILAFLILWSLSANASDKIELKSPSDSLSYAIGMNIGKSLSRDSLPVDINIIKAAMQTALKGENDKLLLKDDQVAAIFQGLQAKMQEKMAKKQNEAGAANAEKGKKFLDENKTKEGVKVTKTGLQYKVLKSGNGKSPSDTNKVSVHYHGTLIDGTVFDSSIDRGKPIEFGVNGVIPGWTEALKMMKEGDEWMLYIPSDLAYGAKGAGGQIGPNSVLVFKVQLLEVK